MYHKDFMSGNHLRNCRKPCQSLTIGGLCNSEETLETAEPLWWVSGLCREGAPLPNVFIGYHNISNKYFILQGGEHTNGRCSSTRVGCGVEGPFLLWDLLPSMNAPVHKLSLKCYTKLLGTRYWVMNLQTPGNEAETTGPGYYRFFYLHYIEI